MSNSGAKAALQGYRLQALYILNTVLCSDDLEVVFLPEGKEDLDIFKHGNFHRSIQIKSHSTSLSYSEFNPSSNDSFFRRSLNTISKTKATVEVVSFGPVGTELLTAWKMPGQKREELWKKFNNDGYTRAEYDLLINKVKWKNVSESELTRKVYDALGKTLTGGNPNVAFEWLMYWIFNISERSQKFTHHEVVSRVGRIGKYLEQRAAHHMEWFTSIRPLEDDTVSATEQENLASEFYSGVSANYRHIAVGVDVIRKEKLESIENAFQSGSKVVLMHGASGQGKSALAYRYFHDYLPENWRFEIKYVEGKAHASRIAQAIADHHAAFSAPIYIFLDVRPGDSEWPELVRRLVEQPSVRVLIAIRQEDLVRTPVGEHEIGLPAFIELKFDRLEAKLIFESIIAKHGQGSFPSFDDAWTRFGGRGPLMEFVFLLTQTESLKARLKNQVARLQEEVRIGRLRADELRVLRICAVATAFEARIDVRKLCHQVKLAAPLATLQMYDREYLIRLTSHDREIVCLHALRSEILVDELCDKVIDGWGDAAIIALKVISDDSLESFLLYAFSRHSGEADKLFQHLLNNQPRTWTGLCGVARAVLWLGIRRYVDENIDIIKSAQNILGRAWIFGINFDLVQSGIEAEEWLFGLFEEKNKELADKIKMLKTKQTLVQNVFISLRTWIEMAKQPDPPEAIRDWNSFTEFLFWLSFLGSQNNEITSALLALDFAWPIENLRGRDLAKLYYSLELHNSHIQRVNLEKVRFSALSALRDKFFIFNIEKENGKIRADYIITPEMLVGTQDATKNKKFDFTDRSNAIIEQLRLLFPNYESYGTQGYGHNLCFVDLGYDFTVKDVSVKYLQLSWLTEINSTFLNLVEWIARPDNWFEYGKLTLQIRMEIGAAFLKIKRALIQYFNSPYTVNLLKKIDINTLNRASKAIDSFPLLPKLAVDEWGKVSETKVSKRGSEVAQTKQPTPLAGYSLVRKHKALLKIVEEYISSCGNFFQQSQKVITRSILQSICEDEEKVVAGLSELGLTDQVQHLSAINLSSAKSNLLPAQNSYKLSLGSVHDITILDRQSASETKVLKSLYPLWLQFLYKPTAIMDYAETRCNTAYEDFLENLKVRIESLGGRNTGFTFAIKDVDLQYEDRTTLWISVDVSSMLEKGLLIDFINDEFCSLFKLFDYNSYDFHILNNSYETVVFILNYKGYVYSNFALCIPMSVLVCRRGDGEKRINPLLYARELDNIHTSTLGFEIVELPSLRFVNDLHQKILKLGILAAHLSDFRTAPQEIDNEGDEIINSYIIGKQNELQKYIDEIGSFLDDSNIIAYCKKRNNSKLNDVLAFLMDNLENMMPKSDENDRFTLDAQGLYDWSLEIFNRTSIVEISKWYFLEAELGTE